MGATLIRNNARSADGRSSSGALGLKTGKRVTCIGRVGDEDGLRFEYGFHFAQSVGEQGAAGGDNVENRIGKAQGRCDFNGAADVVQFGVDVVFF